MTWGDALPWFGSVTGVLWALLLAFGLMSGLTSMVVMQSVFTVTSLIGIYRWLIAAKAATFACETSLEGAR